MKNLVKYIRNFFRKIRTYIFKNNENDWIDDIPEIENDEVKLIEDLGYYSMTPLIRRWSLIKAIHYINKKKIEGDIVECGIWRGGNLFIAKSIQENHYNNIQRNFYGYDTFEGMPKPISHDGLKMINIYNNFTSNNEQWFKVGINDVKDFSKKIFNKIDNLFLIKGKVEDTLKSFHNLPKKIALLRLDTDWYESTKIELEILYPLLSDNGILIIDDYGDMPGCRKAVDEFFLDKNIFLHRVDKSCRILIKN
jgi:O-methyltransferase